MKDKMKDKQKGQAPINKDSCCGPAKDLKTQKSNFVQQKKGIEKKK